MQNIKDDELSFKLILIGDQGVGKSSILMRYAQNEFKTDYNVTIGVEFTSKDINIDDETAVKLQIWDTAGQESFRAIIRSFYRNASAVFLVYQINNKETFSNIKGWLEEVRENSNQNIILVLMGNQSDRTDREVSFEEGEKFMKENDMHFFFETSAKDGSQIEKAFEETAKMIFLKYVGEATETPETVLPEPIDKKNQNYRKLSNSNHLDNNKKPVNKKKCC